MLIKALTHLSSQVEHLSFIPNAHTNNTAPAQVAKPTQVFEKPDLAKVVPHITDVGQTSNISRLHSLPKPEPTNFVQTHADQQHFKAAMDYFNQSHLNNGPFTQMLDGYFNQRGNGKIGVVFADIPVNTSSGNLNPHRDGFVIKENKSDFLLVVPRPRASEPEMFTYGGAPGMFAVPMTTKRIADLLGVTYTAVTNKKFPLWTNPQPAINLHGLADNSWLAPVSASQQGFLHGATDNVTAHSLKTKAIDEQPKSSFEYLRKLLAW